MRNESAMGLVCLLAWCTFGSWIVGVACCVPPKPPSAQEVEMVACVAQNDSGASADACADRVRAKYRDGGAR